jgi:uncharacterized protein
MSTQALAFLTSLSLLLAWVPAGGENALSGNPSPYLAMHGQDPVAWRDWGPQVLAAARASNRLIFISSGYFACHWCHVMQRESFRNPSVAALLNRHFVPVKVDRELHPALDAHLIGFVERTRGQAGWPLNVFLTPQGYPLVGLTYAPAKDFEALLGRLADIWARDGGRLAELARRAAAERVSDDTAPMLAEEALSPSELSRRLKGQALRLGDELTGGFGSQTRFPMAPTLRVLLDLQSRAPDQTLGAFLVTTLDAMANRGLRDHLGGGFFRYTVDPDWQTPHFEKMLYTQALLVPLYLRAAEVLGRPDFRAVARDTLDFMLRGLNGTDGGLIASLSAVDGAGVEGGYYLWEPDELERLLTPEQRQLVGLIWGLEGPARQAAGLLPVSRLDPAEAGRRLGMTPEAAGEAFAQARKSLLSAREQRRLPRDEKQLAGWNGLALSALAAGARVFDDRRYREAGARLRDYLVGRLWDGKALHRAVGPRGWIGEATLEDYALVAGGLKDWGKLSGSSGDLALSRRLVAIAWERFYHDGWRLAAEPLLPGVPAERAVADNPLPSPAAVLLRLSLESEDPTLVQRARQAMARSLPTVAANPVAFASQAGLLADSLLEETGDGPASTRELAPHGPLQQGEAYRPPPDFAKEK